MRKKSFSSFYDSNSNTLQLFTNLFKRLHPKQTKNSPYPVAVLAGQFKNDYKTYSLEVQGKYLKLNGITTDQNLRLKGQTTG